MKKFKFFIFILVVLVSSFFWALSFFLFNNTVEHGRLISAIFFAGGMLIFLIGASSPREEKHFPTKRKIYLLGVILGILSFLISHFIVIPSLGL